MFHHLENKAFLARSNNEVSSKIYFNKQLLFSLFLKFLFVFFISEIMYFFIGSLISGE